MSTTTMKPGDTTKVVASKLMHENLLAMLGPKTAEWLVSHTKVWKRQVQYRIPRKVEEMADARTVLKVLKLHEFTGKKGKGLDRLRKELREQLWDILDAQKAQEAEALAKLEGEHEDAIEEAQEEEAEVAPAPAPKKTTTKKKKTKTKSKSKPKGKLSDATAQVKAEKKTSLSKLLSEGPATPSQASAVIAKIESKDETGAPVDSVLHVKTKGASVALKPGDSIEIQPSDGKVTISCMPVAHTPDVKATELLGKLLDDAS